MWCYKLNYFLNFYLKIIVHYHELLSFWIPLTSPSCLIVRILVVCWILVMKMGIFVFLGLKKRLCLYSLSIMWAFHIWLLLTFRLLLIYWVFIMAGYWILWSAFSVSFEIVIFLHLDTVYLTVVYVCVCVFSIIHIYICMSTCRYTCAQWCGGQRTTLRIHLVFWVRVSHCPGTPNSLGWPVRPRHPPVSTSIVFGL